MKKAIIFKSKQLAKVSRESFIVFVYLGESAWGSYEYVDYGISPNHCYMKEETMKGIISRSDYGELSYYQFMEALTFGSIYGVHDMMEKYTKKDIGSEEEAEQNKLLFKHVMSVFPDYTVESLLDIANFGMRDGLLYNKISYQEAQFFFAWKKIMDRHKDFEPLFTEDYRAYLKKNNLKCQYRNLKGDFY